MGAVRGALVGGLGLVALEVVVSSNNAGTGTGQVAGLFTGLTKFVAAWVDPTVPAIKDRSAPTAAAVSPPPTAPASNAAAIAAAASIYGTTLPTMSSPNAPNAAVAAP